MSRIRKIQINATTLCKKHCGLFSTVVLALLGLILLVYGFSLTLPHNNANTSLTGLLLGLSIPKSTSQASFYAVAGSALLAGAIAISGIVKQRQTARSKNTIDFEASLSNSESYNSALAQVGKIFERNKKYNYEIQAWAVEDEAGSTETRAIKTVLNYWERASNGVRKDVYDSGFLYDIYGTHVINLYNKLLPFIEARQVEQPKAYEHFLALCENWVEKRKVEDEKKARKNKKEAMVKVPEEAKESPKGSVQTRDNE